MENKNSHEKNVAQVTQNFAQVFMGSKFSSRDIFCVYVMLLFFIVVTRLSYQQVSHHYGKPVTMNYLSKIDSSKIRFKHYSRLKILETYSYDYFHIKISLKSLVKSLLHSDFSLETQNRKYNNL